MVLLLLLKEDQKINFYHKCNNFLEIISRLKKILALNFPKDLKEWNNIFNCQPIISTLTLPEEVLKRYLNSRLKKPKSIKKQRIQKRIKFWEKSISKIFCPTMNWILKERYQYYILTSLVSILISLNNMRGDLKGKRYPLQ